MSLNYLTEHVVILAVVALLYQFLYRRNDQYVMNRIVLLGTLSLSIIIPLFDFAVFPYELVEQTKSSAIAVGEYSTTILDATNNAFPAWNVLYVMGCVIISIFYLKDAFLLFRVRRSSNFTKSGRFHIAVGEIATSFSFLNYLFIEKDDKVILAHEKAHAQLLHSIDRMLLAVIHIIFWFNPLLLLYRKWLIENHEFAADKLAIQNLSMKRSDYAQRLVAFGNHQVRFPTLTNKFSSELRSRLIMLNTNQKFHLRSYAFLGLILIALCSGCTIKRYPVDSDPGQKYRVYASMGYDLDTGEEEIRIERCLLKPTDLDNNYTYKGNLQDGMVISDNGVIGSSMIEQVRTIQSNIDDTTYIDPETHQGTVIISKVKLPDDASLNNDVTQQRKAELLKKIGEYTSLTVSTHAGTEGIFLLMRARNKEYTLNITDTNGKVTKMNVPKLSPENLGLATNLPKGDYILRRSDGGQKVVVTME